MNQRTTRFSPLSSNSVFFSGPFLGSGLLLFAATACGGGGGGGGGVPGADPNAMTASLAGSWSITETVTSANSVCASELGSVLQYTVQVTQTGSQITVVSAAGTFQGTVQGNTLSWTGSYPEDGGTTTITSMSLVVVGDTLSGNTAWSWTDGVFVCAGTTSISGARQTAAPASTLNGTALPAPVGLWQLAQLDEDGDTRLRTLVVEAADDGYAVSWLAGGESVRADLALDPDGHLVMRAHPSSPASADLPDLVLDERLELLYDAGHDRLSGSTAWRLRDGEDIVETGRATLESVDAGGAEPMSGAIRLLRPDSARGCVNPAAGKFTRS